MQIHSNQIYCIISSIILLQQFILPFQTHRKGFIENSHWRRKMERNRWPWNTEQHTTQKCKYKKKNNSIALSFFFRAVAGEMQHIVKRINVHCEHTHYYIYRYILVVDIYVCIENDTISNKHDQLHYLIECHTYVPSLINMYPIPMFVRMHWTLGFHIHSALLGLIVMVRAVMHIVSPHLIDDGTAE